MGTVLMNQHVEIDLLEELALYSSDPLGFVMFAFPWGEPDGELADYNGPELWQKEILIDLGEGLIDIGEAIQLATASGHGIGKSALVAWIILWAVSTFEDTKGVVTANTENQLKTKTWAEVAKWFRMFIGRDYFKLTATALFSADPEHERTWRIDMVPWSERNTEAFAGMHNQGKRIVIVFDEGSAIPDIIWEVTEGALTDKDTQIIWAVFGNPTRNKGRFRECFTGGKFAHRWQHRRIDSRSVSFTDKPLFERWVQDYGEDSDFVRVRVKGEFPRVDAESFIPLELCREASTRAIELPKGEPVVLGVDVGRFGDDPSVIYPRKGRDAETLPIEIYPYIDTMDFADKIVACYYRHHASWVFVDSGGVGGGVVDRLRKLRINVQEVDFGSKPDLTNEVNPEVKYANKRAEIWGAVKDWLKIGRIPERIHGLEVTLLDELSGPTYQLNTKEAIQLETKKDMRRRGIPSPNVADALACTFAFSVFTPGKDLFDEADTVPLQTPDYNPYDIDQVYAQ